MSVKRAKKVKILRVAILAFLVYSIVSFIVMQVDINNRKQELASASDKLAEQQYLNKEISSILDLGNSNDYITRIAREKLGYVYPDERVFIDINGSK